MLTEARRAYIYSVLAAAGVLAVFYGLMTSLEVAAWAAFAAVVLQTGGNILARLNVTTKAPEAVEE